MRHLRASLIVSAALTALGLASAARAEVVIVLDEAGRPVPVAGIPGQSRSAAKSWEPAGAAPAGSWILDPDGDLRRGGLPSVATNPLTGLPSVAWSLRVGKTFDIVVSTFDGDRWSDPVVVHAGNSVDDLDPRIAFTTGGVAVVVWWERSARRAVRLAWSPGEDSWVDVGTISDPAERASRPALLVRGDRPIVAYRTPEGLRIVTPDLGVLSHPWFADGPTPFPENNNDPNAEAPPER